MAIHKITLTNGRVLFIEEDYFSLQLGIATPDGTPTYALCIAGHEITFRADGQKLLQRAVEFVEQRDDVTEFTSWANFRLREVRFGDRIGAFIAPRDGWVWFDAANELHDLQVFPTKEEAQQALNLYKELVIDWGFFLRQERQRGRPRMEETTFTFRARHPARYPPREVAELLFTLLQLGLETYDEQVRGVEISEIAVTPAQEPTHEPATPPPGGPTPAAPDAADAADAAGDQALSDLGPRQ